ncbi:CU044_5270 family protein [Nonomuraea sp. NPDC049695]|uniref:CU044_5270 family protein n=1 Tax=Nonomuraea sp. NPDC049695 TaxID=3154734 RepID=UPI0034392D37
MDEHGMDDHSRDEDEIRLFADGRPTVPPFGAEARARARQRLLAEARGGGRFRLPSFGWQAAAAFGATVVLVGGVAVALSNQGQGGTNPATSVTQSAAVASSVASSVPSSDELNPRPGQFIEIESDTMYGSFSFGKKGENSRYLYKTHRKIWQSVDGSADGLLLIEGREPQPWPGMTLPKEAKDWKGSDWHALPVCSGPQGDRRTDYAYLSSLPTDADGMRTRLYEMNKLYVGDGKGVDNDRAAFDHVTDLVRETYMPKAQRDALFEAARTIPGVQVAEGVEDAAGRKGVALGQVDPQGILRQAIFDPVTHLFMGERHTVVDEKRAQAPKDSVLALTSQLKVSVVDELPQAKVREGDTSCASATFEETTPSPSGTVTPSPSDDAMTQTPEPLPTMTVTLEPETGAVQEAEPTVTVTETATPTK